MAAASSLPCAKARLSLRTRAARQRERVEQRGEQADVAEPDLRARRARAPTTASSASASTSASAASQSVRPKDSMPACTNSPVSPARSRNTGPQ